MTLMNTEGHLTDEALQSLTEGALCEVQRVEVAEHLTLCDLCLLRMTALDEVSLTVLPPRDLVPPTLQLLRRRRLVAFVQRCGIVAAAAAFVLVSWAQAAFGLGGWQPQLPKAADLSFLQQMSAQLSDSLSNWGDQFSEALRDSFEKASAS